MKKSTCQHKGQKKGDKHLFFEHQVMSFLRDLQSQIEDNPKAMRSLLGKSLLTQGKSLLTQIMRITNHPLENLRTAMEDLTSEPDNFEFQVLYTIHKEQVVDYVQNNSQSEASINMAEELRSIELSFEHNWKWSITHAFVWIIYPIYYIISLIARVRRKSKDKYKLLRVKEIIGSLILDPKLQYPALST